MRISFLAALALAASSVSRAAWAQSPVRPLPLTTWRWDTSPRNVDYGPAQPSAAAYRTQVSREPASGNASPFDARPIEAGAGSTEISAQLPFPSPEPEQQTFGALTFFGQQRGDGALQDGSADIGLRRLGFDASYGRANKDSSWAVHVRNEATFYDWQVRDGGPFGAGDPFNDMYLTRFGFETERGRDDDMSLLLGTEVAFGGEDESTIDDSFQIGGLVGARVRASENLTFDLGLAGLTRLEDDPWLVPYVGFDWRMHPDFRLASEGSEIHFDWFANERLRVGLEGVYEYRNFRLNEDGPLDGGAFRDEEIRVGLNVAYQALPGVTLEANLGRVIWSEFGLHQDGERISEVEGEQATFLGLGLQVSL